MPEYEIEFYEEDGRQPFRRFLDGLDLIKRLAMVAAIEQVLTKQGVDVCRSSWGKTLGQGLFEFRVRHTAAEIRGMFGGDPLGPGDHERPPGKILLRAFCHAYGDRIVLLLGGYDKGVDSSKRRQQEEIKIARKRLRAFKASQRRRKKRKS
jgi:hypothetical protein